ncbi:unnamed protein product [Moneuplotes crassus]|uniref:Uncharacterized protein n=1 Tax=Euplotes crassus TaxID=5936 RepID=A0AAD1XM68_EUPCR|nr:unnamed protein product [Moneuplotes crassus]
MILFFCIINKHSRPIFSKFFRLEISKPRLTVLEDCKTGPSRGDLCCCGLWNPWTTNLSSKDTICCISLIVSPAMRMKWML